MTCTNRREDRIRPDGPGGTAFAASGKADNAKRHKTCLAYQRSLWFTPQVVQQPLPTGDVCRVSYLRC